MDAEEEGGVSAGASARFGEDPAGWVRTVAGSHLLSKHEGFDKDGLRPCRARCSLDRRLTIWESRIYGPRGLSAKGKKGLE